jgi:hypothetical protein
MDNLIQDDEPEISPIEKPKRQMNEKTREALALGRKARADKIALAKSNQKSIPEPILKKKVISKQVELPPVETPKATPKRKQKQVIVIQSDDDEGDDDTPTIIIKRKSNKKADLPPPQVFDPSGSSEEPYIEEKPLYRMRRI